MFKKAKIFFLFISILAIISIGFLSIQKPKVTVVLNSIDSEFGRIVKAGAKKGFKDFGIDGKVIAPLNGSAKEQRVLLEVIYEEEPDLLIVSPIDASILPMLRKFTVDKDIPVLLVNQDEDLKTKTAYIGTDNHDLGRKAASLLASHLQPGNQVAILRGDLSMSAYKERITGAKSAFDEAGITVAVETVGINEDASTVETEIKKILNENPDINGFLTSHDYLALPVINYLKKQGISVPVVGSDGISAMVSLVEDGTISCTVAQNPYDMGYLSVKTALDVTEGNYVEKFVNTGVDIIIKENAQEKLDFITKFLQNTDEASS